MVPSLSSGEVQALIEKCLTRHNISSAAHSSPLSAASDPWDWDEQEIASFEKLNQGFIQGQQLASGA